MRSKSSAAFVVVLAVLSVWGRAEAPVVADYTAVYRIMDDRCIECHAKDDYEGGLILEDYQSLLKGGETGAAIVPGKSGESLLVKYLRGEVEKEGKKKFMPPGKRTKLTPEEIQIFTAWIDAGAKPNLAAEKPRELVTPKVAPKVPPRRAVYSLAYDPVHQLLAVGRFGEVELLSPATRQVVRTLTGLHGNVNGVVFSSDGNQVFAASGENSLYGEVKQWKVADGTLVRSIQGHRDTVYALALSPDDKTLATGSYDQQVKLWSVETGAEIRTLRGHNGAVFAVAFRPDGKILASASADRTVKLWDTATGQRRDTFSQPLKEQVALAWSGDGKRLAAGGFDNRIRVWEISDEAKETTNPLLVAQFAHEGPITRLVWSPKGDLLSAAQDGTVKLWDGAQIKERLLFERQSDWPSALAFTGAMVVAGRLDGGLGFYDAKSGAPMAAPVVKAPGMKPPEPPVITAIEPRGVQRGEAVKLRVKGKNLTGLKSIKSVDAKLALTLLPGGSATEALVEVKTPATLRRGAYALTVDGADGKASEPARLFIDDLPQKSVPLHEPIASSQFPVSCWGVLAKPGQTDRIEFEAKAGETMVFDLAGKSIGSKTDAVLSLVDERGRVLASNNDFDATSDPLIAYSFTADGHYAILVSDLQFAGSPEHFYRLSAGALPFVTAFFPLSVAANKESEVELIGYNLPPGAKAKVKAGEMGDVPVPVDPEQFRFRRDFRAVVHDLPHIAEVEPNDTPTTATLMPAPGCANGRISAPRPGGKPDIDYYRFEARAGSKWVIETEAAQRGAPTDTKIEVLDDAGHPVVRLLMQAVRDSAVNFRAIDSTTGDARVENWREMDLNQWMYMSGEIVKIFRMPEGPDSGFEFYKTRGKRAAYFDTTSAAHALDEPCYIVEPHPPGSKLVANGLPVFPLYYANDDDGERKLGTDSRVYFTAPKDGAYLVAVSDSRDMGGDRYVYNLIVREPKPDFVVRLEGLNTTVNAGSGQAFSLIADRKDGFDGDIKVEIAGVPSGWKVTSPLLIQAGHEEARGTAFALDAAKSFSDAEAAQVKITASSMLEGASVIHDSGRLGKLTLGPAPQVKVALEPAAPGDTLSHLSPATPMRDQDPEKPFEITIAPGETIPAWIKLKRGGKVAEVRFDVDDLPHGVIVDNLGLNGITLLAGQSEGEIHLRADPWVGEMDRLCFAVTRGLGAQTSLPVVLHVRKKAGVKSLNVR